MDNMPPLPNSEYGLSFYDEGGAHELPGCVYTDDQMHAYARTYAEQRTCWNFAAFDDWWDHHGCHNARAASLLDAKDLMQLAWDVARERAALA